MGVLSVNASPVGIFCRLHGDFNMHRKRRQLFRRNAAADIR